MKSVKVIPVSKNRAQLVIDGNPIPLEVVTVLSNEEIEIDMDFVRSRIKAANDFLKKNSNRKAG